MVKRVFITVLALLLLGAIINIAVAWGCAWFVLPMRNMNGTTAQFTWGDEVSQRWVAYCYEEFGTTRIVAGIDRDGHASSAPLTGDVLPAWSEFENIARVNGDAAVGLVHLSTAGNFTNPVVPLGIVDDARGWPMRSMRCWWDCGLSNQAIADEDKLHAGILLAPYVPQQPRSYSLDEQRAFPLQPIALGFLANTMFYAITLYILGTPLILLRRALRRVRGGCPKCGYPAGTSPVCTECGAPLPTSLVKRDLQETPR